MTNPNILLFTHPDCVGHIEGSGHPEQPARLAHIIQGFKNEPAIILAEKEARPARQEEIALAHTNEMIDLVYTAIPEDGFANLDADTVLSPVSGSAARRAAGGAIDAAQAVCDGPITTAFCAVRPPGHHATGTNSGGFCLFNNIALAALHALERDDIERIAIFDFDVHHGNGTQDIFWDNPHVKFASIHQSPLFPYSGDNSESGAHNNILNMPVPARTKGKEWLETIEHAILPQLANFKPDLLLVSAGFDAHIDDPLASLDIQDEDFGTLGEMLRDFAHANCEGKTVFTLEGGYDLAALSRAPARLLKGFLSQKKENNNDT